MKKSARLYNCARCHCQVIICSHCDRSNIYCTSSCSQSARSQSRRRAGKKYQSSRKGRFNNAQRQQRYRQRQMQKVTHQGSTLNEVNALLQNNTNRANSVSRQKLTRREKQTHCHFCHCECDSFLRRGFIGSCLRYP